MGFLNTADDMVDNSMKLMKDVLDSKFTSFIQSSGTPILVTYYNLNEVMTTVDTGTETIDSELGEHSPLRFNKVLNFPIYGLGNGGSGLIPTKEELDGGLIDMGLDLELVILPNSIKPSGYDYFIYKYDDNTSITFKVTDFEMSTIKSNNYYKISASLKDINDHRAEDKLNDQTVEDMECILNRFGTTERCIIKKSIFDTANSIERVIEYITELYIDTFYNERYKCVCFRQNGERSIVFDPYLTKFIYDNNIMDYQKKKYVTLIQHDTRDIINKNYNKSIYKNIELRDKSKLFTQLRTPVTFSTSKTNPFDYYGEDSAFTIDIESHKLGSFIPQSSGFDRRLYVPELLMQKIDMNDIVGQWETFEKAEDETTVVKGLPKKMKLSELLKYENPDSEVICGTKPLYKVIPKFQETINNESTTEDDDDDTITNIDEDDYVNSDDLDYADREEKPICIEPNADHHECSLHIIPPASNTDYFPGVANVTIDKKLITGVYSSPLVGELSTTPDTSVFGYDENKYTLFYWNLIITYINKGNLMDLLEYSNVTIEDLLRIDIENDYESFIYIPIVLYILHNYIEYIRNNG